jgi:thymidylate synthase (FAD)
MYDYSVVKCIGISAPEIEGLTNAEDLVAYAARVSNPSNQMNNATTSKLLAYLIKHAHWSPFEMVSITMEIQTTRDIARQILRHRSFSFQEFSQRYADPTQSLGFMARDARLQDTKNRQNSIPTGDKELIDLWDQYQGQVIALSIKAYNWAISNGIAKEQARAVLPEGNVQSRLYMAGTLRSWIHYCQLRSAHGTQLEHIDVANKCWDVISTKFPSIAAALEESKNLT